MIKMNEEELQWLKEISTTTGISYSGDRTITTDFANELIDYIKKLEQSQNNCNELKKWLEEVRKETKSSLSYKVGDLDAIGFVGAYEETLNKMQELGWDND